ncbi:Domain of uncharacterised function (DUF2825) [Klebsiella variicola]|nr:hypothetical protein SM74_03286 [Klebsiella variicola]SBH83933.1 Domain of uncharacterised function (DUF2825) [Klebsiella variicola]SXG10477.1 Domain of uncharacterised function (DUF2825) [Klebsiella variicola]
MSKPDWGERFIPAGAGNTHYQPFGGSDPAVYPRWRGEHPAGAGQFPLYFGLSPLARGTHWICFCCGCGARFIPAGAGNTSPSPFIDQVPPVYPRWRGEHHGFIFVNHGRSGLSPLARGTLSGAFDGKTTSRFIPAGAGNTGCAVNYPLPQAVYPRWRGEHFEQQDGSPPYYGLSPLARGTRLST